MPEEVRVNKELGIIEVRSHGPVTRDDLFSVLEPIEALARETGINKVLVDTSGEEHLPGILDLDDFAASIPCFLKVALVVVEKQPTAKKASFVSNAAFCKGVEIQTFPSRESSLAWLKP